jgi:hypothetical protein
MSGGGAQKKMIIDFVIQKPVHAYLGFGGFLYACR